MGTIHGRRGSGSRLPGYGHHPGPGDGSGTRQPGITTVSREHWDTTTESVGPCRFQVGQKRSHVPEAASQRQSSEGLAANSEPT